MDRTNAEIALSEFYGILMRYLLAIDRLVQTEGYKALNVAFLSTKAGLPEKYFKSYDMLMEFHFHIIGLDQCFKIRVINENQNSSRITQFLRRCILIQAAYFLITLFRDKRKNLRL